MTEPDGDICALTVAVLGSGPAGCYSAQSLRKKWPDAEITIFEALPAPYGLVRYGIAADHQGTKAVTRQFDRLFERESVRFAGNVTIGRDVDFATFAASFDVVVMATGLPHDRQLDVDLDPRARVIGAGSLMRALNGYPATGTIDVAPLEPLGARVAIVGAGNVAIDVLRMITQPLEAFAGSDVEDDVLSQLCAEPISRVHVIARSAASQAKFDTAMIREFAALRNVDIRVEGTHDSGGNQAIEFLIAHRRDEAGVRERRVKVDFHFETVPTAVNFRAGETVLEATRASGSAAEFAVDSVVTAIGFAHQSTDDPAVPDHTWDGHHVYRVGWLSGSHGALPRNRADARALANTIEADVTAGRIRRGAPGYRSLHERLAARVVDYAGWKRIETHERATAHPERCRRKVVNLAHMLAIATEQSIEQFTEQTSQSKGSS